MSCACIFKEYAQCLVAPVIVLSLVELFLNTANFIMFDKHRDVFITCMFNFAQTNFISIYYVAVTLILVLAKNMLHTSNIVCNVLIIVLCKIKTNAIEENCMYCLIYDSIQWLY